MSKGGLDCTHKRGECMSMCRVYLEMKDGPKSVSNISDGLRIRLYDNRYIDLDRKLYRGLQTRAVHDIHIHMSSGMYVLSCGNRQHRAKLIERIEKAMKKESEK